ncbi:hypothetical protein ACHAW6_006628 [Cyclotella cf. meneghiniana]
MIYNAVASRKRHKWRHLPAIQYTGTVMSQANAAVDKAQWSSQMITSLDKLANAAVQKNNTVEKLVVANKQLTNTITKLQEENARLLNSIQQMARNHPHMTQHQNTTPRFDPNRNCHTHSYKVPVGHNSKTCKSKKPEHQDKAI